MLLQGSYAEDAFDLRIAGGPYIYKGFMIKGTVNILGWEIYAHVKLSDEVRKTTDLIFQMNFCLMQIIDSQKARASCLQSNFVTFFQFHNGNNATKKRTRTT